MPASGQPAAASCRDQQMFSGPASWCATSGMNSAISSWVDQVARQRHPASAAAISRTTSLTWSSLNGVLRSSASKVAPGPGRGRRRDKRARSQLTTFLTTRVRSRKNSVAVGGRRRQHPPIIKPGCCWFTAHSPHNLAGCGCGGCGDWAWRWRAGRARRPGGATSSFNAGRCRPIRSCSWSTWGRAGYRQWSTSAGVPGAGDV